MAKAGLFVSLEKTEFFANITEDRRKMLLDIGKIKRTGKIKYFEEWIESNLSEKVALSARVNKMELTYRLAQAIYSKLCLSFRITELIFAQKPCLGEYQFQEEILRKILGPLLENGESQRCNNSETKKVSDVAKKRQLAFYGYLSRMSPNSLANNLFTFWNNKKLRTIGFTKT